jgi:hypothetical protein
MRTIVESIEATQSSSPEEFAIAWTASSALP